MLSSCREKKDQAVLESVGVAQFFMIPIVHYDLLLYYTGCYECLADLELLKESLFT